MEINAWLASCGNMWACLADGGNIGMSNSASWVDWMVVPSGSITEMLLFVGVLLMQWLLGNRKWPVVPVSAIRDEAGIAL